MLRSLATLGQVCFMFAAGVSTSIYVDDTSNILPLVLAVVLVIVTILVGFAKGAGE